MSPLVRLHTYPLEDAEFASGVNLEMDIPGAAPILEAVLARLQARYPRVAINVVPGDDHVAWHVYRDGLPH